jgi:hypothetical protein
LFVDQMTTLQLFLTGKGKSLFPCDVYNYTRPLERKTGTFRIVSQDASKTRFNISNTNKVELLVELEGAKDVIVGGTVEKLADCLTINRIEQGKVIVGMSSYMEYWDLTLNSIRNNIYRRVSIYL